MPAITASTDVKILVTGGTGFLGMWAIKTLLDRGYAVLATVRSASKADELKAIFPSAAEKLQFSIVEDIVADGAFDEAVKGVDGILHMAAPIMGRASTAEEYIRICVDSTVGLFKSAMKNAPSVKRIVTTSSVVSVWSVFNTQAKTYGENDWNDEDVAYVNDKSKELNHVIAYSAAKTLSEKAAWEFFEKNKQDIKWDVAFILPAMVYGPPLQPVSTPAELPSTLKFWWDNVMGSRELTREALSQGANWVDVRDVAEAHVRALEIENAGNTRFIQAAGTYVWQEWLSIVHETVPAVAPNSTYELSRGFPDIKNEYPVKFDTEKEKVILGIKHKSKEETTKDILEAALKQGWI